MSLSLSIRHNGKDCFLRWISPWHCTMLCKFSVANTTKQQNTFHSLPFIALAGLGWTAFKLVNRCLWNKKYKKIVGHELSSLKTLKYVWILFCNISFWYLHLSHLLKIIDFSWLPLLWYFTYAFFPIRNNYVNALLTYITNMLTYRTIRSSKWV